MTKPIILVVGARPNFMKIAPIYAELASRGQPLILLHTGQHYDDNMSKVFFDDLGMPKPDIYLGIGSGSHAYQTATVIIEFEKICLEKEPSMVVVVGDVNSTVACSIVCAKLTIPCAHVEAGLRSFDREMPEEINRILTDSVADLLLTPSPDGDENLRAEGVAEKRIVRVGNVMIDSLYSNLERSKKSEILNQLLTLSPARFGNKVNVRLNAAVPGVYGMPFIAGDTISYKLGITAHASQNTTVATGKDPLQQRTYKVILKVI